MTRNIHNLITVLSPYEVRTRQGDARCSYGIRENKVENEAEVKKFNQQPWQLTKSDEKYEIIDRSKRLAKVSKFRHEYNRLCRAVNFLPNPVSKMLYTEMKNNVSASQSTEVIPRQTMLLCIPEHEKNREPPCMTYCSPKPSRMCVTKRDSPLLNIVECSRFAKQAAQMPLSTVRVLSSLAVSVLQAVKYLKNFGEIERITHQGPRSFCVVYSSLTSACDAVRNSDKRYLHCNWYHASLQDRKFIRRRNQALHVITKP